MSGLCRVMPILSVLSVGVASAFGQATMDRPTTPGDLPRAYNAQVKREVAPEYSWDGYRYGDVGYRILLDAVIGEDGAVLEIRNASQRAPQPLVAAAMKALAQWEFVPRGFWGIQYNMPGEKPIRFITPVFIRLYECADGKLPVREASIDHAFCPTSASRGASTSPQPPSVTTQSAKMAVSLPSGLKNADYARALVTAELWPLGEDARPLAQAYALGVSRYLDPTARRLEDTPRPRHPRVDEASCGELIRRNAGALSKLLGAVTQTYGRSGGIYNPAAFGVLKSLSDDGFTDAHVFISQPESGCASERIRTLYASVAMIADGHFSPHYLTNERHGRITADDLQRNAEAGSPAAGAAAALAAAGFEVLICDYQDVRQPAVVWYRFSPASRTVRGLDPAAVDLGTRILGDLVRESCPTTYDFVQRVLTQRRPQ